MSTHGLHFSHPEHKSAPGVRRAIAWVVLAVMAATLSWLGFRGYLSPELLFHFANSLVC
jgi:hypothetical protein